MRRVRRKGGNKEKVFGCDLLEHLNASSQEIPQVLRCCSEFVETHGIVDGIYRLSGVSSNIQKLRGEFESDASPDLNKDLYLQDIHCVSSLCKAYFRELPNPLLTYQLYDKFAEAVAIQLEEERLVKIRDVLKELPSPHYRTLEFLMRHLVRMASYSSETNMHARNLAIVWAPNLLRSKDIEASGFNGTAAFMEVRVQSIVVEFILTHVPQLFPALGLSSERRNSLPSPSAASSQEEGFFKSSPTPVPNFGNISPGDGPLAIRPYHAIIEGTDKRKGSLKGRKWMSIFNIGGRFHDPRRRHKHSAKEKDRPVLRPARSMDSLSTPSYPNEGSRRTGQRPPSTNMSTPSPLVTSSPKPGSDATASTGGIGASEYAVTYRRGTGLVSGGAGIQGTYTALDPEGLGVTGNETVLSRSPGLSAKAGRRAAMHITGPTIVTVPLHITSNLALGMLQGGGSDRVIQRGRDKDGGDRVEGKEGGEKVERSGSRGMEFKVERGAKVEEEEKNHRENVKDRKGVVDAEESAAAGGGGEEEGRGKKEEEAKGKAKWEPELVMKGGSASREQRIKSLTSNTEEHYDEEVNMDYKNADENDEYMDMQGVKPDDRQREASEHDDNVFESSDILNSTEVEGYDPGLSGYVQDNFDFLDDMDCSTMDHMDCSVPYQVNEFSVEPPGHSDDEYEIMEQAQSSDDPAEVQTRTLQPDPEPHTHSQTDMNPHRPLSLDTNSRHTKSLSLPYMTSPVHGPEEGSCSEEDISGDDSQDDDYISEDENDDCMFVKSLPADFYLKNLSELELDAETPGGHTHHGAPAHQLRISEDESPNLEAPACKESTAADQEQAEVKETADGLEEKVSTKTEEEEDRPQSNSHSKAAEDDHSVEDDTESDKEQPLTSSPDCCAELPLPSDGSDSTADVTVEEEEKEVVDDPHCGSAVSCVTQEEITFVQSEESRAREQQESETDSDEGEERKLSKKKEDICEEMVLEKRENDENMSEETTEEGNEVTADIKHEEKMQQEGGKEQDGATCRTSGEVWDEFKEILCEMTKDEESKQVEKKSKAGEGDVTQDVNVGEEKEQMGKISGETKLEVDTGETVRIEVEEETAEEKLTDPEMQREFVEKQTNSAHAGELDEEKRKHGIKDEARRHDSEKVVSKEKETVKERAGEPPRPPPIEDLTGLREGRKCQQSDRIQGGVGRKLVTSKNPKIYQVKAVPVVPPKPQHCKLTALTIRQQQQQQRERRDGDRGREGSLKVPTEPEQVCTGEQAKDGGERRDGDENTTSRNSPISMCFDEAVAIATMRREKEKECEKEKERQRGSEVQ